MYEIELTKADGSKLPLREFYGQVLLVVNVASKCGYTPQYEGLESLYQKFRSKGFTILGFPSNDFMQEPGDEKQISEFCKLNYGVSFPIFEKVSLNGSKAHPLYVELAAKAPGLLGTKAIKWNFTKFLVSRDGKMVTRYSPQTEPKDIESDIEKAIAQPTPVTS